MFTYSVPTNIVFGEGALQELAAQIAPYPGNVIIVCEGAVMRATGILDKTLAALAPANRTVVVYEGVQPNPTLQNVQEGVALAQANDVQVVIGLGGGSSMDTAKGVAVGVAHSEHDVWEYLINRIPVTEKTLPIIAISTTSGTGSQATPYAVTTNPATCEKPGMTSAHILPKVAIVDPELMRTVPRGVTVSTGFDVLCHAIEAYTSTLAGGPADANAWEAIDLTARFLPRAVENGDDMEARRMMALADTHAGIAIGLAGVTIAHSLAHAISGHFEDIPHGLALASVYAAVLEVNAPAMPERHRKIARALADMDDAAEAFRAFAARIGLPTEKLATKCPLPEVLDNMAVGALDYMAGCVSINPVPIDHATAVRILQASLCAPSKA